ncbi:MAG: TetR/AcrR family transcriptional regulator [Parvularculaceae bacterium]
MAVARGGRREKNRETKSADNVENAEPKWRRRADKRPDEILDAALEEFTERGFDATRVEDIAGRAAISKAGVYLYFDRKEDILRALIEREIAPIARKVRALAEEGADDPEGTLGAIIAGVTAVVTNPRVFAVPRIVLSVSGRFPEIGAYYREHVVEEALAAMEALHKAGVERGLFRDLDSEVVARSALGSTLLYALWLHVLGGAPDELEPTERAKAQLDLLMRGLAAEDV